MKLKILILSIFSIFTFIYAEGFSGLNLPQQHFLTPDKAFIVKATKDKNNIKVDIKLADKIYMYANKLHFMISKPVKKELKPTLPPTHKHGSSDIFRSTTINIPLSAINKNVNKDYTLSVELTGCSDAGICYQPQVRNFNFKYTGKPEGVFAKIIRLTKEGNTAKIANELVKDSPLFILMLFFIFGLLLSLTPCIFPMIPILSSIIVSQAGKDTKPSMGKAFFTSLVYVLAMALTYTVVGLVAGLLGTDIQAAFAKPWVIILFATMFVALAFSLFGYYEIGLPSSWQSKLSATSSKAQGKGIIGTAIMGSLSAIIVGPCVAPPLGGAILFITQTGDAWLGGVALFVMSIGMGVPLLIVGLGAGKFMPKPGGWMNTISQIFGVMMLMLALYMLRSLISPFTMILLSSLLLIGSALYMGVFNDNSNKKGAFKLVTLFAYLFLIYGTMLFVGAMSGSRSLLHPLDQFSGTKSSVATPSLQEDKSKEQGYTLKRLQNEVRDAAKKGKPVVVDIGKDNCAACTELAEITFPDPAVQKEMKRFKFIRIDITKDTADEQDILKHYHLFGAPNILFFDSKGKVLPEKFLTGFIKPKRFSEHMKTIK